MRPQHLKCLDGIRAIAFLIVFISHAGLEDRIPGAFGVTIFFFLSGYLITSLLRMEWDRTERISLKSFYIRRACRILPPLYVVLALAVLLNLFGIPSRDVSISGLLSIFFYYSNYLTLLSPLHPGLPPGMGVLWSLMVEEHFYLIFPLLYLLLLRRSFSRTTQSIVLLSLCGAALAWRFILVYAFHTNLTAVPRWTLHATDARFDSILWGCILAIVANPWCEDTSPKLARHKGSFAIGGIVLLLLCFVIRDPHFRETLRYTLQGIGLFPVFYYLVASPNSWASRALAYQPLRWLGWVSYSMYLVHDFALFVSWKYFPSHIVLGAIGAFAACAVLSEVIRRGVENPFRTLAHRREARKPAREVFAQ
jgi:peptidoglycan/LPS O-acetylase OafA/YrhL